MSLGYDPKRSFQILLEEKPEERDNPGQEEKIRYHTQKKAEVKKRRDQRKKKINTQLYQGDKDSVVGKKKIIYYFGLGAK